MYKLFTSECVTSGHPDKMCDIISDKILDAYLAQDPNSRVACETFATSKKVIVSGEITSNANVDVEKIVREAIISIGYNNDDLGFNGHNVEIEILLNTQSPDISMGVNKSEIGAGDQGMMFGYATNETPNYIPYTAYFANKLAYRLEQVRKEAIIPYLCPDGKTQVTGIFKDGKFVGIDTIVISSQHKEVDMTLLREDIKKHVIYEIIPKEYLSDNTKIYINPTGRFVIGGPVGDTGLTGRKIIVDTYGGVIPHGGGAFSGKDYTKVDRTAAYYARYVCKNIVASGLCNKLLIQVSFAIGISKPLSIYLDAYDTELVPISAIEDVVKNLFDFSPNNMIDELKLRDPIYSKTTSYSHFGKDGLSYEKLDKVDKIKKYLSDKNN